MDSLLDLSGSRYDERAGYVGDVPSNHGGGGTLGEQRRFADVAADLARSRVFLSVLLDTGRLASFLRQAVAVLKHAAADVSGHLSTDGAAAAAEGEAGSPSCSTGRRAAVRQYDRKRQTRPEPLLRALCSFCLEHSPARSTFIEALLESGCSSSGGNDSGGGAKTAADAADANGRSKAAPAPAATSAEGKTSPSAGAADPCAALFVLCLHPHPPSAAAASTLLQCLLVGGGALGAVSGPSPGAAAGVGVIPAGFVVSPIGGGGGVLSGAAGIGREDPLQAALLERIGAVAVGVVDGGSGDGGPTADFTGKNSSFSREYGGDLGDGGESGTESGGSDGEDSGDDGDAWLGGDGLGGHRKNPTEAAAAGGPFADGSSSAETWPGGLRYLVLRLWQIGGDLAAARAKQQLGLAEPGAWAARAKAGTAPPRSPCAAREGGGEGGLKARAVEMEQELTSILCLLSSLVSRSCCCRCCLMLLCAMLPASEPVSQLFRMSI